MTPAELVQINLTLILFYVFFFWFGWKLGKALFG